MKIAVSGKGGVGKTTLAAMMAANLSLDGRTVVALDADPDDNLASALGVPFGESPKPLSEMRELIRERTGAQDSDTVRGYFKLNPKVDDIPEKYARRIGNIRLLALGGVSEGGGGCICPASALVRALLTHLILDRDDAVVMDMEAGIEHLGRATAQSMDALVIVVNDTPWSIHTALRVRKLAGDLRMTKLFAVANRVHPDANLDRIRGLLDGIPLIGAVRQDTRLQRESVVHLDGDAMLPSEALRDLQPAVTGILSRLAENV